MRYPKIAVSNAVNLLGKGAVCLICGRYVKNAYSITGHLRRHHQFDEASKTNQPIAITWIWRFFRRVESETVATCDFCDAPIPLRAGEPCPMKQHLYHNHDLICPSQFARNFAVTCTLYLYGSLDRLRPDQISQIIFDNENFEVNKHFGVSLKYLPNKSKNSFLVNVHVMNEEWIPKTLIIHTNICANTIAAKLTDFRKNYLSNKPCTVIIDHETYKEYVEDDSYLCAAYKIDAILNKWLKINIVEELYVDCCELVRQYEKPTYEKIQQEVLQTKKSIWASAHMMIDAALKHKESISRSILGLNKSTFDVELPPWEDLEQLKEILDGAMVVKKDLCQKRTSISAVRPLIFKFINTCVKLKETQTAVDKLAKSCLAQFINQDFDLDTENITIFIVASYFDPRFKLLKCESMDIQIKFNNHLIELICQRLHHDFEDRLVLSKLVAVEMISYALEQEIVFESCPLNWWNKNEKKFPHLAKYAKQYLCIPATLENIEVTQRTFDRKYEAST